MFSWARKQRLSERTHSEAGKSCSTTVAQSSYPSSPSHSAFSINSPNKYTTPQKKLKIILHKKEGCPSNNHSRKHGVQSTGNIDQNMTRSQLLNMINAKNSRNSMKQPVSTHKTQERDINKIVKVKIEVNRMLDQYCRVIKEVANNDTWGIFNIALVMLKMGFIHDLVNDRDIVKQLWNGLKQPDQLNFYVYLEQALGNRVQIDLAQSNIANQLQIPSHLLNKQSAIRIMAQKGCSYLHEILKLNRLCRYKKPTTI